MGSYPFFNWLEDALQSLVGAFSAIFGFLAVWVAGMVNAVIDFGVAVLETIWEWVGARLYNALEFFDVSQFFSSTWFEQVWGWLWSGATSLIGEALLFVDDKLPDTWSIEPATVAAVVGFARTADIFIDVAYLLTAVVGTVTFILLFTVGKVIWRMIPVVGG